MKPRDHPEKKLTAELNVSSRHEDEMLGFV
jgi:hypothetical protein